MYILVNYRYGRNHRHNHQRLYITVCIPLVYKDDISDKGTTSNCVCEHTTLEIPNITYYMLYPIIQWVVITPYMNMR